MNTFIFGKGGEIKKAATMIPAVGAADGNRCTIRYS